MYEVIWQEGNGIEILLTEELTSDEFKEVIHQLESLCAQNQKINVLFDTAGLKKYDFRIFLEDFEFYRNYKSHLNRMALVSDNKFHAFTAEQFDKFTDTEFKSFPEDGIEQARKWIFPSRLPG